MIHVKAVLVGLMIMMASLLFAKVVIWALDKTGEASYVLGIITLLCIAWYMGYQIVHSLK